MPERASVNGYTGSANWHVDARAKASVARGTGQGAYLVLIGHVELEQLVHAFLVVLAAHNGQVDRAPEIDSLLPRLVDDFARVALLWRRLGHLHMSCRRRAQSDAIVMRGCAQMVYVHGKLLLRAPMHRDRARGLRLCQDRRQHGYSQCCACAERCTCELVFGCCYCAQQRGAARLGHTQ